MLYRYYGKLQIRSVEFALAVLAICQQIELDCFMNKPTTTVESQTNQGENAAAHPEARTRPSLKDLLLSDEARTNDLVPARR